MLPWRVVDRERCSRKCGEQCSGSCGWHQQRRCASSSSVAVTQVVESTLHNRCPFQAPAHEPLCWLELPHASTQ